MGLRDRLRTILRLFARFSLMVAVGLASAIITIRVAIRGHVTATPNLVGVPLETAARTASGLGLDLRVEDKLFSVQYPAGQIISQVPGRGSPVKVGQDIHVLVSLGPPRVKVPDLVGDTLRAAQITAVERGMTIGDVAQIHWPDVDPDQVVAQDPPPAKSEMQSPAVNILVSLGEPPAEFLCPDFVGRPLAEARRELEKSGFKIGAVAAAPAAGVPLDSILSQTPAPGTKIGADAVFDFQVSAVPQNNPVTPSNPPGSPR